MNQTTSLVADSPPEADKRPKLADLLLCLLAEPVGRPTDEVSQPTDWLCDHVSLLIDSLVMETQDRLEDAYAID